MYQIFLSGSGESCLSTCYHVCSIMLDTPVKADTIPYNPKPLLPDLWRPLVLTRDRHAYVIEGGVAAPAPLHVIKVGIVHHFYYLSALIFVLCHNIRLVFRVGRSLTMIVLFT